ncbi:unannotated protein [freshwater metagenome]|uniref:Unannotated protein n=1 Tax=freshwater metagenome TaxID=449393 RepID=A0A6J7CY84_9ZZZZ
MTVRPLAARPTGRSPGGAWHAVPSRGEPGEIDIEATVEAWIASAAGGPPEVVIRQQRARRRAVVLAADVSGSSRGPRLLSIGASVGALTASLRDEAVGVLAFWSDAATICELGEQAGPDAIIDRLARIPARGLTNVAFPLEIAAGMLAPRDEREDRRVLLLSDCVHNAGPDPRPIAARLPRVDVLLDVSGECDRELAQELAREGRGLCLPVRTPRDIPRALSRIFGD